MLSSLEIFLQSRNVKNYLEGKTEGERTVELDYDIPSWLSSKNKEKRLENFHGEAFYEISFPDGIKKRFADIVEMNKNFQLSLQILLRDGTIKDFWPIWDRQKSTSIKPD